MNDDVFYVYPQSGSNKNGKPIFDKSEKIAARFLVANGKLVVDPNPQGSEQVHIYRRLNSDGRIDESSFFTNSHNYLIVPVNDTPAETMNYAASVDTGMAMATALGGPETDYKAFLTGVESGKETEKTGTRDAGGWLRNEFLDSGLEGKTPVEKLRHHAAQARADAAQKSASKHKKLRLLVKKRHNTMPSFAPHSGRPTGQPTSAAHSDTGFRSDPALARSSLQRKMDDLLQNRMTGVTAEGFAGTGNAAPEIWDAAEFLPAGSHGQTEHGRMTRTIRATASLGLRVKPRSGSGLPSMAPRMSSLGSGDAVPPQRAMLAGDAPMPHGSPSVQATGSLMPHPGNIASATSLAPRAQSHAETASYALETGFAQSKATQERELEQTLRDYFFRQSRLPPSGATAFDPSLTPAWAGMKIPG